MRIDKLYPAPTEECIKFRRNYYTLKRTVCLMCFVQKFLQEDISAIFRLADKDNSGTLTVKEIKDVLADICERYPQVSLYLKSKQMKNFLDLLKDSEGNHVKESKELDIEEFKKALANVDSKVKMLPATAQVIHGGERT